MFLLLLCSQVTTVIIIACSIGLSFCHELIKDDEEEKKARSEVKSPSQVSSALRKFLKIGQSGEDKPSSQEDTKQDEHSEGVHIRF